MSIADALAQTYDDRCDIYRYEKTIVNGITKSSEVLKYSEVPCALSQGSLAKIYGENAAEIPASSKVFFLPDVDLKEGDRLIITQQGSSYNRKYTVGEIFLYSDSHLEARVSRNDKA